MLAFNAPVADAAGKVQAVLLQVFLKQLLPGGAAALWADVRRGALVDSLMGCGAAAVGQEHGRRALCARLPAAGRT